jgi:hypothetical protein
MAKKGKVVAFSAILITAAAIALAFALRSTTQKPPANPETQAPQSVSTPPPHSQDLQNPLSNDTNTSNAESTNDKNPVNSNDAFLQTTITADQPFEDWLVRFGYDLSAADVIAMLKGDMTPLRKRRLLDFFISESDEGYKFFSSQSGTEFLEQVLTDASTDAGFALRVGNILRWFGKGRTSDMSDQYESRFAKSKSETEKIGLTAAISDGDFLKKVAYDHTQPELVRRVAIENLLLDDKDPKTLKGLIDISDTQPTLSATVLTAAVRACVNRDEFQSVLDVLKKEGMYTPLNARIVGEALATSRRSYWARSVDAEDDEFLTSTMKSYRAGIEAGLRPPPFP